jgi:glutathione S-transferase
MIKLYGGARSRASIVQWYLEELEISYEFVMLDMQAGEHRNPEFLAINPFGKVPAIVDGGVTLWESGAILLYLAEAYGGATTAHDRAVLAQWTLFGNATLGPGVFVESSREKEMPRLFGALSQILEHQPFLLGDRFTAADVAVGSYLAYIPMMLKIGYEDYPVLQRYVSSLMERPGFQNSIGAR